MTTMNSSKAIGMIKGLWNSPIKMFGRSVPGGPIIAGSLGAGLYSMGTHKQGNRWNGVRDVAYSGVGAVAGAGAYSLFQKFMR